MAEYLLRNSLNPGKVIKCAITFRQIINKGEEAEPVWLVELRTLEPHKNGGEIPPVYVHYTSASNLDEAIKEATEQIAAQVDWGTLYDDVRPPFVSYNFPTTGSDDVSMFSSLILDMEEDLPGTGIDPDSIEVTINGIDVTDEVDIYGTPYNYRLRWDPSIRVLDYY